MLRVWLFIFATILAGILPASAFLLRPISLTLEPSGRNVSGIFRLENNGREPAAIQVRMVKRLMDPEGNESYTPADDQFSIYPSQTTVQTGKVQIVRVTWRGPARLEREEAFRLVAEQLPVNYRKEDQPGGKLNLMLRYMGTVYVTPRGARPEVALVSAAASEDQGDELHLVLENRGNAHAILNDFKLVLTGIDSSQRVELGPDQLQPLLTQNILARQKRRFVIPWPAGLPKGAVSGEFRYTPPGQ